MRFLHRAPALVWETEVCNISGGYTYWEGKRKQRRRFKSHRVVRVDLSEEVTVKGESHAF